MCKAAHARPRVRTQQPNCAVSGVAGACHATLTSSAKAVHQLDHSLASQPQVIVFEPLYDSYVGMCQEVGAKLVPIQLQPPSWSIPEQQLAATFSERTKFVLVNTPHNPTGAGTRKGAPAPGTPRWQRVHTVSTGQLELAGACSDRATQLA